MGAATRPHVDCEQVVMGFLQAVGPFFVILVVLVVVHELGHFLTAKWFGVKVLEFGIGYPPKLWGKKFGDTEYTINVLPLGGFVRLLGEEDPSDPRSLAAQKAWKRIVIMGAGSFMNVLLPIVLFAIAFMIPQEVSTGSAMISSVAPGSPAERAGVHSGDLLLAVNGREARNVQDAAYLIRLNQGEEMTWRIRRQLETDAVGRGGGAEIVEVSVYARWAPPQGQGPTGISLADAALSRRLALLPNDLTDEEREAAIRRIVAEEGFTEQVSYPVWEAIPRGARATMETLVLARNQVISWIAARQRPEGLTGPVGIAQVTGEVVEQAGWVKLFELAALLSINLAILNILPLPMLDGGRIFFVFVEILRGGRRIAPEKEALVHFIGFVVLIGFVIVISVFDVMRIFRGEGLLR
jgi:regulator of sigma E protease